MTDDQMPETKVFGCDNCFLTVYRTSNPSRPESCSGCGGKCFTTILNKEQKDRFRSKRNQYIDESLTSAGV